MNYQSFRNKILDNKGRLFGWVNIIDFFFLFFFFILIFPFIFSANNFYVKAIVAESGNEGNKAEKTAKILDVKENFLCQISCSLISESAIEPLITMDDYELDNNGQIIGKILKRGKAMPHEKQYNMGQKSITLLGLDLREIPVTLELKVYLDGSNIFYKGQPLNQSSFVFSTAKYNLVCKI